MVYLTLAAGIVLLLVCGDGLVRGAVALAVRLNIPVLVIGLTIVAFGTSAPELVVSLRAALAGVPGIAIGNVVGSNIANILLVLGMPAMLCITQCNQPSIKRNFTYVVFASLIFIGLCFAGPLGFIHGLILFSLIVAFLLEAGHRAMKQNSQAAVLGDDAIELIEDQSHLPQKMSLIFIFLIIGMVGLPLGAHMTVDAATILARQFGVSEATIGLTIVALGTSLPELATTLSAARRGQCGLALGNVLGSNMFNLLAIMGITAMVAPIEVPPHFLKVDLWVMLAATLALTPFIVRGRAITRFPAVILVLGYVAYIFASFSPHPRLLANEAKTSHFEATIPAAMSQ